jgi:hypothetical protein
LYDLNKRMITSGLVVQNYGKGTFPSSRKSSHRVFVHPHTDNFSQPIPAFSRPFDEKFVKTVDYRKVFGRGVSADEKLYYLEHDMYQKIKRVNDLPLQRRTRSKIEKTLRGGTLMDKFLFLEKMLKNSDGGDRSMSGIEGWIAGNMREPGGDLISSDGTMSLDTRSILRSAYGSSVLDLENYQREILERSNSITSELLDSGDLGSIINTLNLTDFDPTTDDLIGDVIMAEGDYLPPYEPAEEQEDVDMPPEYASRRSSMASVPLANTQMNNIMNATENVQSILGSRRRSSGQTDLPPTRRVRRFSAPRQHDRLRRRGSGESMGSEQRPRRRRRVD